LVGAAPAAAQVAWADGRFDELRRAAASWEKRPGPERAVVDMVCLVPDVPTFLEAIAAWDERHFFPVLIDDVETTLKFLRAFRPARVVRYPSRGAAIPAGALWERALTAVGRAWATDNAPAGAVPRGDVVPRSLGATPPGVVVAAPDAPALPGAVALAAGRFQPLFLWQPGKGFDDRLPVQDALRLAAGLEQLVADHIDHYDRLGDDCDFVTLAGDYPFAYHGGVPKNPFGEGPNAFDDLILRSLRNGARWGFAGRLMGGPVESVYRAMCSLFLRAGSALLFNTYTEDTHPWTDYTMTAASSRLNRTFPAALCQGEGVGLDAWHRTFDPVNRYGLLVINSRGGPTDFHPGGRTADIPETGPAAVLIVHSHSTAAPKDPDTLAGRWLANGAFLYYGALHEPGLVAFRTPTLVAACLSENYPVSAAVRQLPFEPLGFNWRLVFLGDPLYRLTPLGVAGARLAKWEPVAGWRDYTELAPPAANAPELERLNWALKTAIVQLQTGVPPKQQADLPGALLGIARDRLDPRLRPIYDALLTDVLLHNGRQADLIDRLVHIPPKERSADVRRHLETAQASALQRAVDRKNYRDAVALWTDVIRAAGSRDFVRGVTDRVAALADTPARQADWRNRLRAAVRINAEPSNAEVLQEQLKRIDERVGAR
jgi:hypothetical protein